MEDLRGTVQSKDSLMLSTLGGFEFSSAAHATTPDPVQVKFAGAVGNDDDWWAGEPGTPNSISTSATLAPASPAAVRCPKCSEHFEEFGALKRHLAAVHRSKQVRCEVCSADFADKLSLKVHYQSEHASSSSCAVCGTALRTSYLVKKHLRLCSQLSN